MVSARAFGAAVLLFSLAVCCGDAGFASETPPGTTATSAPSHRVDTTSPHRSAPVAPVATTFQNLRLHVAEGVVLEITRLEGALLGSSGPPVFDDQRSFTLRVDAGEIAMTPASLTRLLNDYVFKYEKSPFTNIEVSIENGRLKQKGTLHKGINVPFTVLADISATEDGRVKLHPVKIEAAGIPSGGLMKVFGVELDDLVKSNRAHGIEIVDNDFLLAPDHLLPEPALQGKLRSVRIDGDRIVEVFGTKTVRADGEGNYMYYRGGTLRFGKLTMSDTDMRLIDADPKDPFDFYPRQYIKQLVAGYSKNTPSGGLRVYMPDYDQSAGANLTPKAVLH